MRGVELPTIYTGIAPKGQMFQLSVARVYNRLQGWRWIGVRCKLHYLLSLPGGAICRTSHKLHVCGLYAPRRRPERVPLSRHRVFYYRIVSSGRPHQVTVGHGINCPFPGSLIGRSTWEFVSLLVGSRTTKRREYPYVFLFPFRYRPFINPPPSLRNLLLDITLCSISFGCRFVFG